MEIGSYLKIHNKVSDTGPRFIWQGTLNAEIINSSLPAFWISAIAYCIAMESSECSELKEGEEKMSTQNPQNYGDDDILTRSVAANNGEMILWQ